MITSDLRDALVNLAEEAGELAAAAARTVNHYHNRKIPLSNNKFLENVFKQHQDVQSVMAEISEHALSNNRRRR
jgi:hypothetical protein